MEIIDINIEEGEKGEKKEEVQKTEIKNKTESEKTRDKEKNNTKKLITKNTGEVSDAKQIEEIVKITVSREAETQLLKVLDRVNNGFESGRINRQELASWVIMQFAQDCPIETIKAIRQDHFDEFSYLESILKKARESGSLPLDIRNVLKLQLGIDAQLRKSAKKPVTQPCINDVDIKNEKTAEMKTDTI